MTLFGPAGLDTHGLPLVETTELIEMHEKPAEAVRSKPDSSLVAAHVAVAEGRADAVVSAGNTGAMLAAGLLHLRRIPGVHAAGDRRPDPDEDAGRPSCSTRAPTPTRARSTCSSSPTWARSSRRRSSRSARPEVRLLSIGEEPEKGNQLTLDAHALLAASELEFAGNAESRDLLAGAADVVVCDGFTGNVALKLLEGTIKTVLDALREEIVATPRGKLGGLLIRPAARRLRSKLDPETYGGAYLLGLRGLSVIAHGNSSRRAISNAIHLAAKGVEHDVVGRLAARMPERRTPAAV